MPIFQGRISVSVKDVSWTCYHLLVWITLDLKIKSNFHYPARKKESQQGFPDALWKEIGNFCETTACITTTLLVPTELKWPEIVCAQHERFLFAKNPASSIFSIKAMKSTNSGSSCHFLDLQLLWHCCQKVQFTVISDQKLTEVS